MIRSTILAVAVAATAIIGLASLTPASAHGHGFGFGGIGFGFGLGMLGASIAASNYAADQSCWQYQQIVTPHGHVRTVLVNVCQ